MYSGYVCVFDFMFWDAKKQITKLGFPLMIYTFCFVDKRHFHKVHTGSSVLHIIPLLGYIYIQQYYTYK